MPSPLIGDIHDYDSTDIMERITHKKRDGAPTDISSPKKKQFKLEYEVDESDLFYVNKQLFG